MNIEPKDGILKKREGDYVVYNFKWLLDNLEKEFEHLKNTRELIRKAEEGMEDGEEEPKGRRSKNDKDSD